MTLLTAAPKARNSSQSRNGSLFNGLLGLWYPGLPVNASKGSNANGVMDILGVREAEYLGDPTFITSPVGRGVILSGGNRILHRHIDKTYLNFLHQTNTFTQFIVVTPLSLPAATQTLMVTNDGTTSNVGMYTAINSSSKFWTFITYGSAGNSTVEIITTRAFVLNQPHIIILTCDGATARCWMNGAADPTTAQAAAKQPNVSGFNHELYLGGRQGGDLLLNGIIHAYGFWNRPLTRNEIAKLTDDIYAPLRYKYPTVGRTPDVVPNRFRPFFVSQRGMF